MAANVSSRVAYAVRFVRKSFRYLLWRLWPYLKWQSELAFGRMIRVQTLRPGLTKKAVAALLRRFRIKVIFNLVPGLGHNTVELDQFFRLQALGVIDKDARIILARAPNDVHRDTLSLYRKRFWFATSSMLFQSIVLPAAAREPDLHIDCGLSRLKWNIDPALPVAVPFGGQSYLHQVSKAENTEAWKRYYDVRRKMPDLFPLKEGIGIDAELRDLLGGLSRPLAILHIKHHVANATAAPTDPTAYVPAIRYLQDKGYLIVQVGREPMPEAFRELGVLNYAESALATYRHDLQIFAAATLAITAGSGIATLADCMGTPLLYLDSWHIGMPLASDRCVMIPALVVDKANGQVLTFKQQLDLYLSLEDDGPETFPHDRYAGRNAEADEILAGLREVEALASVRPAFSELQKKYQYTDANGVAPLARARVSDYFIQKHAVLLDERIENLNRVGDSDER